MMKASRAATAALTALWLVAACVNAPPIAPAVRAELAPGGTLRAGINYGNVVLATKDSASGELKGVHVDLARELARRAGVAIELIGYDTAGGMVDGLKRGGLDVALLSAEPARAGEINFSPAYVDIDATYLVPAGSPIRDVADIDRDGTRVAIAAKSAYEFFLGRNLKHAKLVPGPGTFGAYDVFVSAKLDALVGIRPRLVIESEKRSRAPGDATRPPATSVNSSRTRKLPGSSRACLRTMRCAARRCRRRHRAIRRNGTVAFPGAGV